MNIPRFNQHNSYSLATLTSKIKPAIVGLQEVRVLLVIASNEVNRLGKVLELICLLEMLKNHGEHIKYGVIH